MKSKDELMEICEMRLEGKTYAEIGRHFGVSRQAVQQLLSENGVCAVKYGRPIKKCVFPGITNFLREQRLSVRQFSKKIVCINSDTMTIYKKLWGVHKFTLPEIKAILAFTGMTFEEAFGEEIMPTEEK